MTQLSGWVARAQVMADATRHQVYICVINDTIECLYYHEVKARRLESSVLRTVFPQAR